MIRVENLTKVFGNGQPLCVLDHISAVVAPGEFVAVTGPSGSGKSTLLHLIGTLDWPSSGKVEVNGVDLRRLKGNALADFRREHIGFVFQFFNLIPVLTACENVMLPLIPYWPHRRSSLEAHARDLLGAVGLSARLQHLPAQLSGGEQQRVAIARALVNKPSIILADEPTGNVDSNSAISIMALMQTLNRDQGLTIVMVTHDPALARQAHRKLTLRDGRLVSDLG